MSSRMSNIRKLALCLSGTALLAIAGVSGAMAEGGINDEWSHSTSNFLAPQHPEIHHIADYTPPRVNRACHNAKPQLSEEAQHRGEKGDVVIGVFVSTHGRAKKISVSKSSGYEDLDNAAAAAAAGWRYIPAMVGNANVSDWMAVKFHFAAQDANERPAAAYEGAGPCEI